MKATIVLFALLAACPSSTDTEPLVGGDSCTPLVPGEWTFTGDTWGMGDIAMTADVSMDTEACAFTFAGWSMDMDDLPSGGVLDGTAVQLDGLTSRWRTCTGTVDAEGVTITGTCSADGTSFTIALGPPEDTGDTGSDDTGPDVNPDTAGLEGLDWYKGGGGCTCNSNPLRAGSLLAFFGMAALAGARRRRRA